jgi:uncharacterized membrane-anchored protein YitT (DUF2179 family)
MRIKYIISGHVKRPYYSINGRYKAEHGEERIHYVGKDLEDCIRKAINEHPDFGHTYMELDGGYLHSDYDVTRVAYMMCEYVRSVG